MASKGVTVRRVYIKPKRHHRSSGFRFPLAVIAGFVPLGVGIYNRRSSATAMGQFAAGALSGYVPGQGWQPQLLKDGMLPIVLGIVAHKVAGRLGVNRLLAQARVPFVRI